MAAKFQQLPEVSGDIEMEWLLFRTTTISSAVQRCGQKQLRMAANSERRTQDVKVAIQAKKAAFKAFLENTSSSDLQFRYSEVQKSVAEGVKNV